MNDAEKLRASGFVDACKATALIRMKECPRPAGSYFVGEMLLEICKAASELIAAGDLWLLRDLGAAIAVLTDNGSLKYQMFDVRPSPETKEKKTKRRSAEEILKKEGTVNVLRALRWLNRQPGVPAITESQRKGALKMEAKVRHSVLLTRYRTVIENVFDEDLERRRLRHFAALLDMGWLHLGGVWHRCPWFGNRKKQSVQSILNYLKEQLAGDYTKLEAYRYMMARRIATTPEEPDFSLAGDAPSQIWNSIGAHLRDKIPAVRKILGAATESSKPKKRKPA